MSKTIKEISLKDLKNSELSSTSSSIELLIFQIDQSYSMDEKDTYSGLSKLEELNDILKSTLERIYASGKEDIFRVCLLPFSEKTEVIKNKDNKKIMSVQDAIDLLSQATKLSRGMTNITSPFEEVEKILSEFLDAPDVPDGASATIFLFTDGNDNCQGSDAVESQVNKIRTRFIEIAPTIATISFGKNADADLLFNIASDIDQRATSALENAGLTDLIENDRLFLEGTSENTLTSDKAEAIRLFVNTLSSTV